MLKDADKKRDIGITNVVCAYLLANMNELNVVKIAYTTAKIIIQGMFERAWIHKKSV